MKRLYLIWISSLIFIGCSHLEKTWRGLVKGPNSKPSVRSGKTSYQKKPNYGRQPARQYRPMNKDRLRKNSQLQGDAGSLWVGEGQGAYLFSQNIMRRLGDVVSIHIKGSPRRQLESKISVIRRLSQRMKKNRYRKPSAAEASQKKNTSKGAKTEKKKTKKVADLKKTKEENKNDNLDIRFVPSRITEKFLDGSYRIKGQRAFMIGKREYKVIVTGVVRPDDLSDEGIEAERLIDSQFDIVSLKKTGRIF